MDQARIRLSEELGSAYARLLYLVLTYSPMYYDANLVDDLGEAPFQRIDNLISVSLIMEHNADIPEDRRQELREAREFLQSIKIFIENR
jgi:hypothetical protein